MIRSSKRVHSHRASMCECITIAILLFYSLSIYSSISIARLICRPDVKKQNYFDSLTVTDYRDYS